MYILLEAILAFCWGFCHLSSWLLFGQTLMSLMVVGNLLLYYQQTSCHSCFCSISYTAFNQIPALTLISAHSSIFIVFRNIWVSECVTAPYFSSLGPWFELRQNSAHEGTVLYSTEPFIITLPSSQYNLNTFEGDVKNARPPSTS